MESDVVAIVCDGASVMVKLFRVSRVEYQLCIAYGIHLAVMAVVYKKISVHTEFKDTFASETDTNDGDKDEDNYSFQMKLTVLGNSLLIDTLYKIKKGD